MVKSYLYRSYFKLHCIFNVLLDFFFLLLKKQAQDTADLLLIKVDAIGDFILWQDSLRAYRKKYAGMKIVLICNSLVYEVALLDPFFTEVWGIDRKRFLFSWKYRYFFVKQLRSITFREVISTTFSREYYYTDRLVKLALGLSKIGYDGDLVNITIDQKNKSDHYYTKLVTNSLYSSELLINAHFVKQVCDFQFRPQLPLATCYSSGITLFDNDYFVFSISASYSARAWSVENFAKIVDYVPLEYKIVLLGHGKADCERGDIFLHSVQTPDRVVNLINKTTIVEMIEVIHGSSLVIGNDSSAVHIAAATRVPSICIAPGAHYNRFVPYPEEISEHFYHPRVIVCQMPCFGCNYHCCFPIVNQLQCIRNVTVSMVVEELNKLLVEIKK